MTDETANEHINRRPVMSEQEKRDLPALVALQVAHLVDCAIGINNSRANIAMAKAFGTPADAQRHEAELVEAAKTHGAAMQKLERLLRGDTGE